MGNRVSRITDGFSGRKKKETGHDPAATSAALTDRQYNTDLYIPQVASDTAAKVSPPPPPSEPAPETESELLAEFPPDDEALEDAATKIQASYKGYKTRKEIKELKMKTNAATKIQAGIRGHLTRKKIKTMKDEMSKQQQGHHHHHHHHHRHHPHKHMHQQQQHAHHKRMNPESPQTQDENVLLHDPNVHHAATKIQAQFRGFRARQQMKVMKVKANAEKTLPPVDPEDPRAHEAATKIQAMIRGRKARKEMKVLKLQNRHGHNRHRAHGGSHGKPSKSHYKDTSRETEGDAENVEQVAEAPAEEPAPE